MNAFAKSDHGQAYFEFLSHIRKTPVEYGDVPIHNQVFLESAYTKYVERQNEQMEQ